MVVETGGGRVVGVGVVGLAVDGRVVVVVGFSVTRASNGIPAPSKCTIVGEANSGSRIGNVGRPVSMQSVE